MAQRRVRRRGTRCDPNRPRQPAREKQQMLRPSKSVLRCVACCGGHPAAARQRRKGSRLSLSLQAVKPRGAAGGDRVASVLHGEWSGTQIKNVVLQHRNYHYHLTKVGGATSSVVRSLIAASSLKSSLYNPASTVADVSQAAPTLSKCRTMPSRRKIRAIKSSKLTRAAITTTFGSRASTSAMQPTLLALELLQCSQILLCLLPYILLGSLSGSDLPQVSNVILSGFREC